ncbi:MAG: ATP-binding protein [Isosphaeraceae bacterium]
MELPLSLPNSMIERHESEGQPPYLVIWRADGSLIREEPPGASTEIPIDEWIRAGTEVHARGRGMFREVSLRGPDATVILVGRSIRHELAGLRRLGIQIALTGLAVFALGLLGGWWLSSRAVEPIVAMSETVSGITATSLSRRLDLEGIDTELGNLGALINTMLERLEASFAQQIQFTADASHELRTPLSVIRSHVDLALSRPRTAEEYRQTIQACHRASIRMSSLVDGLLTLARADAGRLDLRRERLDLHALVAEQVELLEPLARERSVRLRFDGEPTSIEGDTARLGQLVMNVLTNAIHYNRPGGEVRLNVRRDGEQAVLTVADTGVGIPETDLRRVFDRFYRVDAARNRATGGSGLGLAIARSIVEAHEGTIDLTSQPDVGTTFVVRLPAAPFGRGSEKAAPPEVSEGL